LQLDANGWRLKGDLDAGEGAQRLILGSGAGAEQ